MGGGNYSQDVARQARATKRDIWGKSAKAKKAKKGVAAILDIKGAIRECMNPTPVVVALDVTRSRGDDTKLMYDKLPMMLGQVKANGYVDGVAISFCAIGDATSDKAPLQVGQFEADNRLDKVLEAFWIEEGGGGSGQESYELGAWFYANHSKLACHEQGRKGYFFFVGDEGFYPTLSPEQIRRVCGREVSAEVDSAEIFRQLQEKYNVFFLYCRQPPDTRRANIDAEVRQRVLAAGGKYEGVDIRASLIWNNRNDLDLHVVAPSGEEIYYGHKKSACGGWLDVDQNVRGETTKPVENVQWKKGTAPRGRYRVFVQNYKLHGEKECPTDFRIELELNGQFQHFDGSISDKGQTGKASDTDVITFHFDGDASRSDTYDAYSDDTILGQWRAVLPAQHVLVLDDPKTIVDSILGVLAMVAGEQPLESYLDDLEDRPDGIDRATISAVLGELASSASIVGESDATALPPRGKAKKRGGRTRRLN